MAKSIGLTAAAAFFVACGQCLLAANVTMTRTPNVVRPQTQGAGTYDVFDFFFSATVNAVFTNYGITALLTDGSFADPAREQDDRQGNSTNEAESAGSVDLYANTVWSFAARETRGYFANIIPTSEDSYVPSGSGAAPLAPPITEIEWSVFDTLGEDDNDLNDAFTNGPAALTAPYHLVRLLTTPGATGIVHIRYFDTSQPGIPFNFVFFLDPESSAGLPGDFNHDDRVDAADYVVWRKGLPTHGDYSTWRTNFARAMDVDSAGAMPSVNAMVPEPIDWSPWAVIIGLLAKRRRTRPRTITTRRHQEMPVENDSRELPIAPCACSSV